MASTVPYDVSSLFSVKGMVALITGGGTGIGFMMTRALAEAGAHRVYIVGRRLEVLEAAAASVGKPGVVVPLQCDVTSRASLEAAVAAVERDAGYLNLLVCNSGVGGPQTKAAAPETPLEEWRAQQLAVDPEAYTGAFRVNGTAAWYTAVAFLALLGAGNARGNVEQTSQVVVTSSIAGYNKKPSGGWAYGQSKAAATHLAKGLAITLPQWGVRANCICPGLFPSEMSAPIVEAAGSSLGKGSGIIPMDTKAVPLGRMGTEAEIAGTILYLASKAGGYCNGNIMVIDGGRLGTFPSTGY